MFRFAGSDFVTPQPVADLDATSDALVSPLETPRIHAQSATGARGPRSRAAVPRFNDVLQGGLDPLLEGSRRMKRAMSPC